MKLIVGLGNPGKEYEKTLHNAGFIALDLFQEAQAEGSWSAKFKGVVSQGKVDSEKFILLKPQTYMNLSGESLALCLSFYKIAVEDVLVLSDDMDLEMGTLRFRKKGGHGGHNGLRNIIQHLGTQDFARFKIGVGRPKGSKAVTSHVLGTAHKSDQQLFDDACKDTSKYILDFIGGKDIQIVTTESILLEEQKQAIKKRKKELYLKEKAAKNAEKIAEKKKDQNTDIADTDTTEGV